MKIVDEFTGRILEGRRWSEGLHQAVEAKESVKIKEENQTLATITLQNYFRMYEKLAGMTGTASTEAGEFAHTYGLEVVSIPTNRPMVRARQRRPHLQDRGRQVRGRRRRHRGAPRGRASRCSSARSRSRSRSSCRASSSSAASRTRCSTPSSTSGRRTSSPRPAGRARSPSPPTWPAAASTSCSAATPRARRARSCSPSGSTLEEAPEKYAELLERFKAECKAEGDQVRELGGLYVLGTERHESRRIDNQLRGRAGRQGDPGESRFYLSLEDDLMRLFATGAMNWVMGKAFPDDVPLEAKMVTKAIERAQRTVEDRNFEIRKDVLKYDEVMNEQRKVIYRRRQQILDGGDLRDEAFEAIEAAVERAVLDELPDRVPRGVGPRGAAPPDDHASSRPRITREQLDDVHAPRHARRAPHRRRGRLYEAKEQSIGAETLREIERRVMLSMIDQHWREHLYEMDYLREGINLRAMGQKDPLAEWQREGFDMFEAMMGQIQDDFVAYVSHLQVVGSRRRRGRRRPSACATRAAEDAGAGLGGAAGRPRPAMPAEEPRRRLRRPATARRRRRRRRRGRRAPEDDAQQPVRVEKTPGPQRAVLLRQRQEVQALPRSLNARPPPFAMRDFSDDLAELRRRVEAARAYLRVDAARARVGGARGRR